MSDPFFDASGTLLYLVFTRFREASIPLDSPPFVGRPAMQWPKQSPGNGDQLVIEGRWVSMARYQRLPGRVFGDEGNLSALEKAVASHA